ncbi:MAG: amidohydrolase [Gemmatimonadota bacterium]
MTAQSGLLRARRVLSLVHGLDGDSVWWDGGRVREVGRWTDLDRRVPREVSRWELVNSVVTPGFVDSHTHFTSWALGRDEVRLAGSPTLSDAIQRVAQGRPFQGWVLGQGWDANRWDRPPTRWDLDQIPYPVFLDSLDVHAAWVNSAALKAAGITPETQDPPGGRIVRDGAGVPAGVLLENAVALVREVLPSPPADLLLAATGQAQHEAHRLGVTGIHNVEGHHAFETFRAMDSRDELRLRVLFHHPVADLEKLVREGTRSGTGSEWLTNGGVKMFLDGSLGSRTAWMLEPYEGSRDRGMPVTDRETAAQAITMAANAGLAAVVHAIGDAAVRRALDLMTGAPRAAIRHRIEHFQCVHPADLARAAAEGIVLSMQPAHILTDISLADRHWGARSAGAYAFQSLLAQGSLLAFGSDTPVASIDPREGVFAAMERRAGPGDPAWYPGEQLGFETVVRAYTESPARAASVAHRRGTLAPGMDADLVAWEVGDEVFHGSGQAFRAGRVLLTVVNGEAVYQL